MFPGEIWFPECKPEAEWLGGRRVSKDMSPTQAHARLQAHLSSALRAWSRDRGAVGSEWRFRVAPPGEVRRPLVPDVAYVVAERLRGLCGDDADYPPTAPDVAIEILSKRDRSARGRAYLAEKRAVYLAAGASLVIFVDPFDRMVTVHDAGGTRVLGENETLEHDTLPGFQLALNDLFRELRLPGEFEAPPTA